MPQTPNHGYNVPNQGAENWHRPLNQNFEQFDADVEIRDHAANREEYTPKDGAKFLATDTGDVYVGNGEQWNVLTTAATAGPTNIPTDAPRPAVPAYAEITDSGGNQIEGDVQEDGREGMIEVLAFDHNINIPIDREKGELMGVRQHQPATLLKPVDKATPLLFDTLCNGETLQEVIFHWYRSDGSGGEQEYFTHTFEEVKIADMTSFGSTPQEAVKIIYEKITWRSLDGNIEFTDSWVAER